MRNGMKALAAFCLAATLSWPVSAKVIWDEAADGDLPQFAGVGSVPDIQLSLGVNRVLGQSHLLLGPDGFGDWDNDEFYISLPNRGTLQGIRVSIGVISSAILATGYGLLDASGFPYPPVTDFTVFSVWPSEPSLVENPLSLRNLGIKASRLLWLDQGISSNYGSRWSYEYEFLVTRAPEPGTLGLLGLGLIGLGLTRRRTVSA